MLPHPTSQFPTATHSLTRNPQAMSYQACSPRTPEQSNRERPPPQDRYVFEHTYSEISSPDGNENSLSSQSSLDFDPLSSLASLESSQQHSLSIGTTPDESSSPLFVDNDSSSIGNIGTPRTPSTTIESTDLKAVPANTIGYARARKAEIEDKSTTVSKSASYRTKVEQDPENRKIKELRCEHNMNWGAIANYLNEKRVERGDPPTMTQPAVYSRFVRNAPRIAAADGEAGFDPKDYMHLKHPRHYPSISTARAAASSNNALSKSVKRIRTEIEGGAKSSDSGVDDENPTTTLRKKSKLNASYQELESARLTTLLVEAYGTVQSRIWTFVAHELERMTGKLYDPKTLESRYKAI
ncbi:hypothetical protein CC78DRAFT_598179 [Lojkania enalia]|uniref:Uncharacterized protein n=1 Tax=Lojkania enalia TaxID=147567 RepID=A0A9P4KCE1_9PLEO|nr:hypothetical protein CC78DRAFT_598179 [Didymosphaeria enalia]